MPSSKHINKKQESDKQMLIRFVKQFSVLFFLLLMFDTLLDWLLQLIDLIIELAHLFIELIEYWVEIILTHTLHTNHQESETIIVNGSFVIALFGIYLFYRAAPRLFTYIKRNMLANWLRYSRRKSYYWRSLTLVHKIKLVSLYCFGISCLLFLVTL